MTDFQQHIRYENIPFGFMTMTFFDIPKCNLHKCVDWNLIDKTAYLNAMRASVMDPSAIRELIAGALTDDVSNREIIMKGIDYSYYYEAEE